MTQIDLSSLDQLQQRLKAAESRTRDALQQCDAQNPLASSVEELLAVHQKVRELLLQSANSPEPSASEGDSCEVVSAAIEIEREEHTLKADVKDILKAFFMWKEHPADRVKKGAA